MALIMPQSYCIEPPMISPKKKFPVERKLNIWPPVSAESFMVFAVSSLEIIGGKYAFNNGAQELDPHI